MGQWHSKDRAYLEGPVTTGRSKTPESTVTAFSQPATAARPPAWEEALASRLFRLLAPRTGTRADRRPTSELRPWQIVDIPRTEAPGSLDGTWFPAAGEPRGAVLLLPPWQRRGRAYFHRRGRLQALRAAGYHSLTVDLPNFGANAPPAGFYDREITAAISFLERRCPGLPLHFWGVSSGGYWGHAALAGRSGFAGAMFEDVSPHLLEWAWRVAPWGRPFYLLFRTAFRRSYRFLDARRHAADLRVRRAAYVAGGADFGIPTEASRELAGAQGRDLLLVPGAGHLEAIKRARERVIELALETFTESE